MMLLPKKALKLVSESERLKIEKKDGLKKQEKNAEINKSIMEFLSGIEGFN